MGCSHVGSTVFAIILAASIGRLLVHCLRDHTWRGCAISSILAASITTVVLPMVNCVMWCQPMAWVYDNIYVDIFSISSDHAWVYNILQK